MKDFKGLVKVSDVQSAFNEVVNSINNIIDTYNASARVLDIDYTKGSPDLGASGYTLTIGGLKRVIEIYQGCAIGCKPFKIDDNHCKVTAGYVFTDGTVYRTYEQDMTGRGNVLYYDIDNKRYSFGAGATSSTQSVTIPAITNNNSWGNIYASYNSAVAWRAAMGGQTSDIQGTIGNSWMFDGDAGTVGTWTWNFPTKISGHVKFVLGFIAVYGGSFDYNCRTNGGSVYNLKTTPNALDNASFTTIEMDIKDANGFVFTGNITKGQKVVVTVGNFAITGVTGTVITSGDTSAGRLVKICDLDWNVEGKQLATINKTMTESNNRSITIQAQSLPFLVNNGYTGSGDFVWGTDGQYNGETRIFNRQISYTTNPGGSTLRFFTSPTYLYIPKGVANPLSSSLQNTYKAKYSG